MPTAIREEELKIITKKVYALYAKHGFDGISMDEVSRQTNISKATLYRYFTSKEDIVQDMVRFLISNLDSVRFAEADDIGDVLESIRAFYIKSVLITALSGTPFLTDLERRFPDTYRECRTSMDAMGDRFEDFYRLAAEKGFFRDLCFPLVSRQFSGMLPAVIDMDYLDHIGLTLPDAVRSYYRIFLCQILETEYLDAADRQETYDFVPRLAEILVDDFYIDSIRRRMKGEALWISRASMTHD